MKGHITKEQLSDSLKNELSEFSSQLEHNTNNIGVLSSSNVRILGALGNNTDCTNIVNTLNGGNIYFPRGTYKISEATFITKDTVVRGDGIDNTIIKYTGNSCLFDIVSKNRVTIKDMTIIIENNNSNAINLKGCWYFNLKNLKIIGANKTGIGLNIIGINEGSGCFWNKIENIFVEGFSKGCLLDGIDLKKVTTTHFYTSYFFNCDIGIDIQNASNCILNGIDTSDNRIGIQFNGQHINLSGCYCEGNTECGYKYLDNNRDIRIYGVQFSMNGESPYGIDTIGTKKGEWVLNSSTKLRQKTCIESENFS